MTVALWTEGLRGMTADVGDPWPDSAMIGTWVEMLPPPHVDLLRSLNGMTVFHGAFRLLGVARTEPALDLLKWNGPATWRFAWDERVDQYLIFGETAWGDQYAYRRAPSGALQPEVYFMEGTLLRPQVIAGSFEEFMDREFLRNAHDPYDALTIEAINRLGPIRPELHWMYSPSIALGGAESIDNVLTMPAVTAMTFAGDIATALRDSPPGKVASNVQPWVDDSGRPRLKVTFVTAMS